MEQLKQVKLMRTLYITDILNYNIHLGTYAKKTTAKMRPFIMGKYYGHAIINIFKTYVHLLRIKLFLTKIIINTGNSNILFISTDKVVAPVIEQLATMSMSSYINDVCKGGILTNFKFVSKRKKKKSASLTFSNDEREKHLRFAESENKLNSFGIDKKNSTFYNTKSFSLFGKKKDKVFQVLQAASSFKLPSIKRKIMLNKLYKISHLSNVLNTNQSLHDSLPSVAKEPLSSSFKNLQYVNQLRILEKKKKITIKKNQENGFKLPKIKRKIVLKKFYKISDSNQISPSLSHSEQTKTDNRFIQNKISRSQTFTNQIKEGSNEYLLKVIGKKIYKIYRSKQTKTKTSDIHESRNNISSNNLLNIPTKKKKTNSSILSNKTIKFVCRKPRVKRISSSKLSKVFIKDIYKVYYLEPMKIKIFDAINQNEIKTFDINKIEKKNFRLPKILLTSKPDISRFSNQVNLFNNKKAISSLQTNQHKENIKQEKNTLALQRSKKIPKREFYSFIDQDIQEFFYPHVSPITMEQYQKTRKHEKKKKNIFNKKKKINCQFEEKKYEYIKTGLLNFPQIVIIVGQQKEMKIIKECQKLNILTISISDSDGDPSLTNLFIPGNDDHPISVEYMLKHLAEATEIAKIILNSKNEIKHSSLSREKNIRDSINEKKTKNKQE